MEVIIKKLGRSKKDKHIYFDGVPVSVGTILRIGRRKDKVILIVPATGMSFLKVEKNEIVNHIHKAWGGNHHIMFLPSIFKAFFNFNNNK